MKNSMKLYGGIFGATVVAVFTAATTLTGGVAGLVPAPSAGQQNSLLRGDSTWSGIAEVKTSTTDTMSSPTGTSLVMNSATAPGYLGVAGTNAYFWDTASLGSLTANSRDLGGTGLPWRTAYTNTLSSGSSINLNINSASEYGYLQVQSASLFRWGTDGLMPLSSSVMTSGSTDYPWSNVHTVAVRGTNSGLTLDSASGSLGYLANGGTNYYFWSTSQFSPLTNGLKALGQLNTGWAYCYCNNIVSSTGSTLTLRSTIGSGVLAGPLQGYYTWNETAFSPTADSTRTLGTSSLAFATTYTDAVTAPGTLTLNSTGLMTLSATGGAIAFTIDSVNSYYMDGAAFRPITDNSVMLGSSDYSFLSAYVNAIHSRSASNLVVDATSGNGYLQAGGTTYFGWTAGVFFPTNSGVYTLGNAENVFASGYINKIYSDSGSNLILSATNGTGYLSSAGVNYYAWNAFSFNPVTTNTYTLGNSTYLWSTVYATNGTINTSDARKKKDFHNIPTKLLDVWFDKVKIQTWYWKDPKAGAKRKVGPTAQSVIAAFDAAGLNWRDWNVIQVSKDGMYMVSTDEIQYIEMAAMRRKVGIK